MEKNDTRSATLATQQALTLNPGGVEGLRLMASMAERFGSPDAVIWRQQVLKLEPNSVRARLELATAAVRFAQYRLAGDLLKSIVGGESDTFAYHQSAAALAIALRDYAQAEFHLAKAAKLESSNLHVALNLAVLGLGSSDSKVVADARTALENVPPESPMRGDALRSLINEAMARNESERAVRFCRELLAAPAAAFGDRLLFLTVLRTTNSDQSEKEIGVASSIAANRAEDGYAFWNWLWQNGMFDRAAAWVKALPAEMQKTQPVPVALAEVYARERNWSNMLNDFSREHWGRLDFLRMAFVSRALREQNRTLSAQEQWQAAVRAASDGAISLSLLTQKVASWGWDTEVEQLLWMTADRFPWQVSALDTLYRAYYGTGNTKGLLKVFKRMCALDPKDPVARNNLAATQLLLGEEAEAGFALAKQVHTELPEVAEFATTYAYGLHLQGETAEGLKLMESLDPANLKAPGRALYYCVLLRADGQTDRAREFAEIAAQKDMLPEERALLEKARAK